MGYKQERSGAACWVFSAGSDHPARSAQSVVKGLGDPGAIKTVKDMGHRADRPQPLTSAVER